MHPPDELMISSFLPSMRALVSKRLHNQGFSQAKIANLLEITQASVSFYLSGQSIKPIQLLSDIGISREEADSYSSRLTEDLKTNPNSAVNTLYSIWTELLGEGRLCIAHRRENPSLATCDLCMRTFGRKTDKNFDAIGQVSDAAALLESFPSFTAVMPQVAVNVVFAPPAADSPADIIGIPGRIVKVGKRPKIFAMPKAGASVHLANVLLQVRSKKKEYMAAINIKYDRRMKRILRNLQLRTVTIGEVYPAPGGDPIVEAVKKKLEKSNQEFDALIDRGGNGFEPCLYLFGTDPMEVANLAIRISKSYVAQ